MGFSTKVQLIHRKTGQQWYINFPSALDSRGQRRGQQKIETLMPAWLVGLGRLTVTGLLTTSSALH